MSMSTSSVPCSSLGTGEWITKDTFYNSRRIIAENWENKIKELENRIIAKVWSIIISSLEVTQGSR